MLLLYWIDYLCSLRLDSLGNIKDCVPFRLACGSTTNEGGYVIWYTNYQFVCHFAKNGPFSLKVFQEIQTRARIYAKRLLKNRSYNKSIFITSLCSAQIILITAKNLTLLLIGSLTY